MVSSSATSTRCEREGIALARRGGVTVPGSDTDGGDHAIREFRASWEEGKGILRTSSKEVSERIWKRAPERHATWDAVGEAKDWDVAAHLNSQYVTQQCER